MLYPSGGYARWVRSFSNQKRRYKCSVNIVDPNGMWEQDPDGNWVAQKGDSWWSFHKESGMSWNQTKLLARGYNISKGRDNWKSLGIGDVIKSSNSLQTALESVVSTSSSGDTQLSTSGNPVGSIQEKPEESPIFGSTISYRKSESESFTSPLGDEITVSVFSMSCLLDPFSLKITQFLLINLLTLILIKSASYTLWILWRFRK